MKLQHNCW